MKQSDAVLKLFNSVVINDASVRLPYKADVQRCVSKGYFIDPVIPISADLLLTIERYLTVTPEQLNAGLHKSWRKIATAPIIQLIAEQVLHYFTTYGVESMGYRVDDRYVYFPLENLNVPELSGEYRLLYIRGLSREQLKNKVATLVHSQVAFSKETIEAIYSIFENNVELYRDVLPLVENRELLSKLNSLYKVVPNQPEAYLRYIVQQLTGETLLIKNRNLITKLKVADPSKLSELLKTSPMGMGEIFYRYKPLFLAMKHAAKNKDKRYFNDWRREAKYLHKPVSMPYLTTVTAQLKKGKLKPAELHKQLEVATIWQKIKLLYALQYRLTKPIENVVRVRNGKSYTMHFQWSGDKQATAAAFADVIFSIAENVRKNVDGKTFYIPEYIKYALPTSEKQFVGNVPAGTSVSAGKGNSLIVGINWFNTENHRIDIDLALLSLSGKIGWDARWRTDGVLFSGDVTNAPLPNGASESFLIMNNQSYLLTGNFFNWRPNDPVTAKIFVSTGNNVYYDYLVDPNKVRGIVPITIEEKQNVLGLVHGERFYFYNSQLGNSITSATNKYTERMRRFLLRKLENMIDLSTILSLAGATVINKKEHLPEDYIDLSMNALDKSTILDLFNG